MSPQKAKFVTKQIIDECDLCHKTGKATEIIMIAPGTEKPLERAVSCDTCMERTRELGKRLIGFTKDWVKKHQCPHGKDRR